MGNSKSKPHEILVTPPKDHLPILNDEFITDEDKCYHAEQLLSFSAKDFKIRDITGNPDVGAATVMSSENDSTYTPIFHVDSTEWKNFTGHVGRMKTWHSDEKQERLLFYLSETSATMAAWDLVKIKREEEGEVLLTVTKKAMTLDSQFNVYPGELKSSDDNTKENRLLKLRANAMENRLTLTNGRDDNAIAIVWTDTLQWTDNFRCKIAGGLDHSMVMAIFVAARLMQAKKQ